MEISGDEAEQRKQYHNFLSVTVKGTIIFHERNIEDVWTNNYNPEMLKAWDANMDLQLAYDVYAVLTYIIGYATKDETGMTKELTDALKTAKELPFNELLRVLAKTFVNHRQIGAPEAIYRLLPFMKLCKSNIGTRFVTSGFPENRSVFFVPVKDDSEKSEDADEENVGSDDEEEDGDEFDDNDEHVNQSDEIFEIEGRPGKYKASITIFDQYSNRPPCLKEMTLAQFAITYKLNSRKKKSTVWEKDSDNVSMISQERSKFVIFNQEETIHLPERIKLKNNLGQMSCRTKMVVLRYHLSKKKDGHEQFYSEMLLFSPWMNEINELFPYDQEKCLNEYQNRKDGISQIKNTIFPGESAIDLDLCEFFEKERPTHVFDNLDCQGEQDNEDADHNIDEEDLLDIAPLDWNGVDETENVDTNSDRESGNYRRIPLLKDNALMILTRSLVDEQKEALSKLIDACKSHLKAQSKLHLKAKQLLLLIHGGAGIIYFIKDMLQYIP